ncbi:M48 family peptidase [Fortiea sp. LEGE XX443]|uniref:M48 family peptidase n=1 Tax=Fortiea sp. LEGE XX443 TaxID=1828611 RepID=UPI0018818E73|nr:M48 family peptidase [Fortiea sp. LEGE XX443]MBE9007708.1 M48 family peptidase [Fortiea sp. LEGE XX443]
MKVKNISIKNIKVQQHTILENIFNLASNPTPNTDQIQEITHILTRTVTTIENICSKLQITPANLTNSSRQIYSWFKFLTDEQNLQLHLNSTYRVQQIIQQILSAHGQDVVKVMITFTNLAGLYQGKRSSEVILLKINEGFINASEEVLQALVQCTLFGKSKESTKLIRAFASSEEYSSVLLDLDLITEAIAENPQGNFYNLNELFDKLNYEYFAAHLVKPRLVWSQIKTYRKFGHYEPARDRVVISTTLDSANVPEFVAGFVLYHELLHKHHGTKWVNGKRMVHTTEFRTDEKKFKLYAEADGWLKKLTSNRSL